MRVSDHLLARHARHRMRPGRASVLAILLTLLLLLFFVGFGFWSSDNRSPIGGGGVSSSFLRDRESTHKQEETHRQEGTRDQEETHVSETTQLPLPTSTQSTEMQEVVDPIKIHVTPTSPRGKGHVTVDAALDVLTVTSRDGHVEMRFPQIRFRDRTRASVTAEKARAMATGGGGGDSASPVANEYDRWEGVHQPLEPAKIPTWSTIAERHTLNHASIFVSIAAFRDSECATTLRDLFHRAKNRHRIYVGINEERLPSDNSCIDVLDLISAPVPASALDTSTTTTATTTTSVPVMSPLGVRLLWGDSAPTNMPVFFKSFTWDDLVQLHNEKNENVTLLDSDKVAGERGTDILTAKSQTQQQRKLYVASPWQQDAIRCVGSEIEELRDEYVLTEDAAAIAAMAGGVKGAGPGKYIRRGHEGGTQGLPLPALRGCRVTTRVTAPNNARGPTYGRYITSLFYFNQDYYMVVDSHSRFSIDWDVKMIMRVFLLPTRGVLSHYPNGYTPEKPLEEFSKRDVMSMCKAVILSNGMPKLGANWISVRSRPTLQGFAAAGYMFGDAQYVLDTPFDPFLPYLFDGEEVLYTARMWTSGWDLYCPTESNIFHHYGRPSTPKYWSTMTTQKAASQRRSERRALYLLRRAQPWVQVLEDMAKQSKNFSQTVPQYVPPESRLIISDEEANETTQLVVEKEYYGPGSVRTLDMYWQYTELTDDFVKVRDNERRWEGGQNLCKNKP